MPSPLGEGTRRAALRWLAHLRIASVTRARALFTHHPRYADLTPAQYSEGLEWLRRTGMVTPSGRPAVDITGSELGDGTAALAVPRILWSQAAEEVKARIGAAGERAVLDLLRSSGALMVRHVASISDAFGYDVEAVLATAKSMHVEVKSTTDPTRLLVHLTRHEYEVMRTDPEWAMVAVLVGCDECALSVADVCREWLLSAVPEDRSRNGRWESARLVVPPHALTAGLDAGHGRRLLPARSVSTRSVWGMRSSAVVSA
ncbi:DUF3883 domain-containing protein [Streptomyces sp. NPDC006923]|uniref:protein NO VEIN domain-containing protein n=1 Tax=Streptomyces sp. NPDC006923 TaxID=3155355 RepID=UPI0033DE02FB